MAATDFDDALNLAIVQQVLAVVVIGLSTAHDLMWVWVYAVVAFWLGALLIVFRRREPTRGDVLVVKWGFVPLLLLACYVAGVVWRARGR